MKSRLKQQIFAISLLVCTAISPANALQTHSLREQFQNPSDEAKPWTFWYWMFGAVSKEGITADLEAMKHAGNWMREKDKRMSQSVRRWKHG